MMRLYEQGSSHRLKALGFRPNYAMCIRDRDYTVVNGKVTVRNGKLVNLDEEKAAREAAALVRDYLSR